MVKDNDTTYGERDVKMLKGCSRRVIYLKNTDSTLFDEAYFLLSSGQANTKTGERDMIREAERIISESAHESAPSESKKKRRSFWFCMGGICATALYSLLGVIFYLVGMWSM